MRTTHNQRQKINAAPFDMTAITERVKDDQTSLAALCKVVVDIMQEMHGGEWRCAIDHESEFIVISPKPGTIDSKIGRPERGAVI
jgi:hypothetical protein